MDKDLQQFFAPAAQVRLTVSEKEQIYRELSEHLPRGLRGKPYQGSFLWRMLSGVFSSWAPIAAVVIVLMLAGTGITFAENALPGDFLYPLKRMGEDLNVSVRFTSASRIRAEQDHMDRRLDEANALKTKGKLTPKTTEVLDQEYRLERRQAVQHIKSLENSGDQAAAAQARARMNAAEDRYERLFKGARRDM